jgi:hypothetical protein
VLLRELAVIKRESDRLNFIYFILNLSTAIVCQSNVPTESHETRQNSNIKKPKIFLQRFKSREKYPLKGRIRREQILEILSGNDADAGIRALRRMPTGKIINALFPFFYSQDETIKWRAVTAMGLLVQELADGDMEKARNVVRRLMWNLNDESGGIGWGSPEAMGEILACHEGLAWEYAPILLSYANKGANYLELPMLQRGLLWGIARLAEERSHLVTGSKSHFFPYLESEDPAVRGHAVRIVGLIGADEDRQRLSPLLKDKSPYTTYFDHRCMTRLVGETAREASISLEK